MKRIVAVALVAGGMLAGSVSAAEAATYSLIELVPLSGSIQSGVQGINDNGDAVDDDGTRWDGTTNTPTALNPLSGGTRSYAYDINNNGVAVGRSGGGTTGTPTATRWDGTTPKAPLLVSDSVFHVKYVARNSGESNRATHGSQTVTVANPTSHVTHYKISQAHRILGMHNHKIQLRADAGLFNGK